MSNRFEEIVVNLLTHSNPPYGLPERRIRDIVNDYMVDFRIASEDGSYPLSEARWPNIEIWEEFNSESFETIIREGLADAT